ncbi:DUF6233 domain-containing protein [Streptomyces sp. NPDC005708]
MRPPPPRWLIECGLQKTNLVAVHVGGCWTVRKSSRCIGVSQAQALDALRQQAGMYVLPPGRRIGLPGVGPRWKPPA